MSSYVQSPSVRCHFVREPQVDSFFDARSCSVQYVVSDPSTGRCAVVDPVLDYDEKSGATATSSADALHAFVRERNLTVEWILDTHPCKSANHLTANRLPTLTPIMAFEVIATKGNQQWAGVRVGRR
jgi:hypothetical protein